MPTDQTMHSDKLRIAENFIAAAEDYVDHVIKSWQENCPPLADGRTPEGLWSEPFRRLDRARRELRREEKASNE